MKVMKYIFLVVAAGLLVSGFLVLRSQTNVQQSAPAASTPGQQQPPEEAAAQTDIIIQNYTFTPSTINVRPGEMITITNQDSVGHTFTSNSNLFDTGTIASGQTVTVAAPSAPGRYPFYCSPHPYMTGMLLVE